MRQIRFHTINVAPRLSWYFSIWKRDRFQDQARQEVADFINKKIGDDSLISISEQCIANGMGLTITIWYRADLTLEKPQTPGLDPVHP